MTALEVEMPAGNDPDEYSRNDVEARTGTDAGPEAGTPPDPSPTEPEMRRDAVPDSAR